MNKYICPCCGGTINRASMTCEYCGTGFKEEHDNLIRIETFRNPVRTFEARVFIPDNWFSEFGVESVSKLAVEELVRELSKSIAPMMEVHNEHDLRTMSNIFSGRIKIIQPVNQELLPMGRYGG